MKNLIILLLPVIFLMALFYSCRPVESESLPANMPPNVVIELIDDIDGKTFHLSKDESYCIFKLENESKRMSFDVSEADLNKLYNIFTANSFSDIDTVGRPVSGLPEEFKKPYNEIKISWDGKSVSKGRAVSYDIMDVWVDEYNKIADAIALTAYDALLDQKREFIIEFDKSLQKEGTFVTLDVNTYYSIDSLYYYNSNEQGKQDRLEYNLLNGKNRFAIFYNNLNPGSRAEFAIANSTFDLDIADTLKGIRFYLENDSIRWKPASLTE